ncbi:MAG: hypothetical protein ACRDPO_17080 [Streptosporangiaceae bacterium]
MYSAGVKTSATNTETAKVFSRATWSCRACWSARATRSTDEHGELQSFDDRFARTVDWQARRSPGTARADLERQTLDNMGAMPAWRDHPGVAQRG